MRKRCLRPVLALVFVVLLGGPVAAAERHERHRRWSKVWFVSTLALSAATFLDLGTSVGRYEANPLLRGPGGRFSMSRGIALKSSLTGALIATEVLIQRFSPEARSEKPAAIVNFAGAAALGAIAARNRSVPK